MRRKRMTWQIGMKVRGYLLITNVDLRSRADEPALLSAKLRQVVLSKHGNPKTTTDKVCKFFIEAVENGKYGWFWTCPNGGDKCMYKHSLPQGYNLLPFPRHLLPLFFSPFQPFNNQLTPPPFTQQLRSQNQRTTCHRTRPPRQIPPKNPHPRRLSRIRTTQTHRHPDTRDGRKFCEMEKGETG